MRTSLRWMTSALALAAGAGMAAALMSGPAAKAQTIERQQALNGSLYAVIAPMFDGSGGGQLSFLRLFNGEAAATNFSVTLVGIPSGRTYGTANISVPRNGSPQYPLTGNNSIVSLAGAAGLNGGDTSYAAYIQATGVSTGYQHVIFNGGTLLFGNASACKATLNEAVAQVANSLVLTNVHTTTLSDYPSQVYIHNYWNASVTYKITVIEAATGTIKGQIQQTIGANSTYSTSMAALQTAVGWSPISSEFHANLIVSDTTGGVPYAMVTQQIVNNKLGGSIDMSEACAVNPPQPSSAAPGGGLNGY
jgi:hypothetical protein